MAQEVKNLEGELKSAQLKNSIYTSILEGGSLIIWAVNLKGDLISYNQNYFDFQLDNRNLGTVGIVQNGEIEEIDAEAFWSERYKRARKGENQHFQLRINQLDQIFWKEVFLNPIKEKGQKIQGISALAYDITEKMNAQLSLIKSERKFRNIFESFQDVYFRCDLSGTLTMLSPSIEEITGYKEKELLNKEIANYYLYKKRTKGLMRALATKKAVRNFHADIVHKSGDIIPCICNVRVIDDPDLGEKYIEGVVRDITELSEKNKQLQHAKEVAENSLKIKERFLANMSHEIRTPLNGIIGMTHLLEKSELSGKQQKQIKALASSSEILMNILNDLLDISKIEAGKMVLHAQPVKTKDMIDKLGMLYSDQATINNVKLKISIDQKVPEFIFTDETKIIQIFSNFISNAIKFTPDGGEILVKLSLLKRKISGKIELIGEVVDTGIGIDSEDQKELFNIFTQLDSSNKKSYKGTGLGLYLAKKMAQIFDGDIGVDSTPGEGSRFWFTFNSSTTRIRPSEKMEETPVLEADIRVLLVDDNMVNLELANEILSQAGCAVKPVNSGKKAIREAQKNTFDLIIMDIQMPQMDGVLATKEIKKLLKNNTPPVLAMTAYSMSGDKDKFLSLGFDDYLAKPIKPNLLLEQVEKWSKKKLDVKNQTSSIDLSEVKTIDAPVLMKLAEIAGDEAVLEALGEFKQECDRQLVEMKSAYKAGRIKEILDILHTIKGNAGTLGIAEINRISAVAEEDFRKDKFDKFDEYMKEITEHFEVFKKELQNLKAN